MFVVKIYNMETEEEFVEIVQSHKELDTLVESMHNIYGDILHIDVRENQDAIKTKRYSERPDPLEESKGVLVESLPEWLSLDLTRTR